MCVCVCVGNEREYECEDKINNDDDNNNVLGVIDVLSFMMGYVMSSYTI